MALLAVDEQVAALLGGKAAVLALERPLVRVHALVDLERPLACAGVAALGALHRQGGLVAPGVLAQGTLVGTLEVTVRAAEGVLRGVLDLNVGLEVAFHGTAVVAEVTLVGLLPRMHTDVALQVRVNLEFGIALVALEWAVSYRNT